MILLAIDRGNTFTKLGVFSNRLLQEVDRATDDNLALILNGLLKKYSIEYVILSSVRKDNSDFDQLIDSKLPVFKPNAHSTFPFKIDYENVNTIGFDRLANATGAVKRFPNQNLMVVDFGTCNTYTLVEKNIFKGGAIAPGVTMRLKALNHFTGKLPLIERSETLTDIPGSSTESSIRAGVELASLLETDAMIERFRNKISDLNVLITGGEMSFFERHLKSPIFAAPYLTLEGLYEIFILNNK